MQNENAQSQPNSRPAFTLCSVSYRDTHSPTGAQGKLHGVKTKEDANIHMNHLCYPPTPICPSTDSILQLDITLPHRQEEREEEKTEAEVGRQTTQRKRRTSREEVGSTVPALDAEQEKVTAARTWSLVR
ncbi:hypothetical protein Q5P01_020135 [Channa striata]|uniref:Uncharacterized protein n=1 Tax=Channa striata TaxID=64152 RepID=A0AA88LX13_CHASR|nr:hypothetical protein Q5P01_020135 [Channa striata]